MGPGEACVREGAVSNRGAGGTHFGSVWVVGGSAPPNSGPGSV